MFVVDEYQYLYLMARQSDEKEKPKGGRAKRVRDALLSCLGVGRALKVKVYFITQSAKCSKLNLNDDDFDNATSIFLGKAITNALETELKGTFSATRIAKVTAEYAARKAAGQKYVALFSDTNMDKLYLFQPPQPGYYHDKFLTLKQPSDPGACSEVQTAEHPTAQPVQPGTGGGTSQQAYPDAPPVNLADPLADPPVILSKGSAACPACGTFSESIRNGKVNTVGKVKFSCKNSHCSKKVFSAKPVD
jgi:hypothetical protein